jgi:hypothetical protein
MTSDLPGELGSEPGLDRLLKTLASGPTSDELAGEQQALAMFLANIHPLARDTAELPVTAAPGPADSPARHRSGEIRERARLRLAAPRARLRLAAAAVAVAMVGGFAAAAYASALPAPVQHVAYQAFHILGVPDSHHTSGSTGGTNGTSGLPGPHQSGSSGPSRPGRSHGVSPGTSASPRPSASGRNSAPTSGKGNATVTASAAAAQVAAGGSDTIDGQLTRAGAALSGVTVSLWERLAGRLKWRLVGQATTGSTGDVAIGVTSLTTNATFRMTDPDGPMSPAVLVSVVPEISTTLTQGSRGVKDYLHVATQFAHRGDRVELEAFQDGAWVVVKSHALNANGTTTFVLGARKYNGVDVQVVLLATHRHAQAVSAPLTVPPPA